VSDSSDAGASAEGVERALLGQDLTLTAADVAARAGLPEAKVRRIWHTLGFPERGDDRAYNDDDAAAMTLLAELVEDGLFDFDLVLNVVRGAGLSMARLADW
jgi:adenylate cyclase